MSGSFIRNMPATPAKVTSAPKIAKNLCHSPRCVMPSKSPKIISIDRSGRTASTDSVLPRFPASMESVIYALKAASFAVEPKKVITQSSMTTITAAAAAACAGKSFAALSTVISPKAAVDMPHRM